MNDKPLPNMLRIANAPNVSPNFVPAEEAEGVRVLNLVLTSLDSHARNYWAALTLFDECNSQRANFDKVASEMQT